MKQAKNGDKVRVHYTGRLRDGKVFDSSRERQPLEFTIGDGQIIPGFEEGIIDMKVGETKSITVTPDKAYGPRREEWVIEVTRENFPSDATPEIGNMFQVEQEDGNIISLTVVGITETTVTLDANHPLAGQDLIFDVEMISID